MMETTLRTLTPTAVPVTPSGGLTQPGARGFLVLLAFVVCGCWDLGGPAPDAGPLPDSEAPPLPDGGLVVEVSLAGLAFRPFLIEVPRGTIVRWTNYDAVSHTVTEGVPNATQTPVWDSPLLSTAGVYERQFNDPGEWLYYCRTHPQVMRDNIVRVF